MKHFLWMLANGGYQYELFKKPLPIWNYWYLLLLPLCLAISIVYKAIRCESMRRVPREAIGLFVFIIVVMVAAAGALAALVNILE
jgi:membrane protein YdbS with pleckstrin-like domain